MAQTDQWPQTNRQKSDKKWEWWKKYMRKKAQVSKTGKRKRTIDKMNQWKIEWLLLGSHQVINYLCQATRE
jgi:hypothetical protein